MTTQRQIELIEKEDWRFYAIDFVGTGLGSLATTEKYEKKNVSFGLPSAPALYLSLAQKAHQRRLIFDQTKFFVKHPEGTWVEDSKILFDFFEEFSAEIIFSFTALEAFANELIPKDFT